MPARRKRREELVDQRDSRVDDVTPGVLRPLGDPPKAKADWPDVVVRLWNSFFTSGQVEWWQDSDVAYAFLVCDELAGILADDTAAREREEAISDWAFQDPEVRGEKPPSLRRGSSARYEVLMSALNSLMVTESDRRKVRLELRQRDNADRPSAQVIDIYQRALGIA